MAHFVQLSAMVNVNTILEFPEGYTNEDVVGLSNKYSTIYVEMKDGKTFEFHETDVIDFEEETTAFKTLYEMEIIETQDTEEGEDLSDTYFDGRSTTSPVIEEY